MAAVLFMSLKCIIIFFDEYADDDRIIVIYISSIKVTFVNINHLIKILGQRNQGPTQSLSASWRRTLYPLVKNIFFITKRQYKFNLFL